MPAGRFGGGDRMRTAPGPEPQAGYRAVRDRRGKPQPYALVLEIARSAAADVAAQLPHERVRALPELEITGARGTKIFGRAPRILDLGARLARAKK